nr:hypothetical protein [Tanacetum cinerariifolium]
MRSTYQLCSSVPSIPHSFAATTERPSHSCFSVPSRKMSRITSFDSATDLEDCLDESFELSVPRKTSLRDDVVVRGSDEPYSEPDMDPEIQAEIDECIAYADALRAGRIDSRVVVEAIPQEEVETSMRGPVKVKVERVTHPAVSDDIP